VIVLSPNLVVCIKQVPDPDYFSGVSIDPITKTITAKGIPAVMNPLDKNAVEEALRVREKFGGVVTVVSMGSSEAGKALQEALAMGADEAVLLSDRAFEDADTLATSYTLAMAIKTIGEFDLVFCGNETSDGGTAQVGPQLAEFLGIPHVTCVEEIEFTSGHALRVRRSIEHGYMIVETRVPVLLAVAKGINKPRRSSIHGILAATKKTIRIWKCKDINVEENKVGRAGSPTYISDLFTPQFKRLKNVLQGKPDEVSKELFEKLRRLGLF
jgi:electron transfer flavoprotein beta subunit